MAQMIYREQLQILTPLKANFSDSISCPITYATREYTKLLHNLSRLTPPLMGGSPQLLLTGTRKLNSD